MKILIGVSGGIAAYKIADLVSDLAKNGHEVRCILTENAKKFISPLVLETLSGLKTADSLWTDGTEHIRLARWPEVFLIAPATANTLAKFSLGLCDDLLSTVFLATDLSKVKVLIAPAMNTIMYQQEVVQSHLRSLEQRGVSVIPPVSGVLACKEEGEGKLPPVEVLREALLSSQLEGHASSNISSGSTSNNSFGFTAPENAQTFVDSDFSDKFNQHHFLNRKILITGGPTISRIDAVRYITNPSTGKMALALAQAAAALGADVTFLLGKDKGVVSIPQNLNPRIRVIRVETAEEMLSAALSVLPQVNGVIACAAVMDYEVSNPNHFKTKRLQDPLTIELKPAPDVLATLKQKANPETWFLGFAAETDNVEKNAKEKMIRKQIDFLFANSVAKTGETIQTGFGSSMNAGILYVNPSRTTENTFAKESLHASPSVVNTQQSTASIEADNKDSFKFPFPCQTKEKLAISLLGKIAEYL